jgi:type VI secretion system VgrG family protein
MKRFIEIDTPLEPDMLLFHTMRAKEELSRQFEYELYLLSPNRDINLDDVLGKSVTVKLELDDEKVRSFSGYVTRLALVGMHGRYYAYRAMVRPWLWMLTRTTNCRIFQEKNVPDILKEVFAKHSGIADVKFELTESYSPWDYCVQYRETDFDFVSRLMEHEGIYYFFKHTEGRHTMVIADSYSAHTAANGGEIPFIEEERLVRVERQHISDWSISHELQAGKYAMTDYDFEKPSVDLQVKSRIKRDHAMAEYEHYDYPGDYLERGDGEVYVRTRIEEVQAKFERVQGKTNSRSLATGYLFSLTSHPRDDQNTEYLVVSAEYELKSPEYEATGASATGAEYHCTFSALNSHQPFRAERITPKPIVQGPQTALTVGPSGETIHTDKFGRVKVQFHWDRYGKKDDKSSCWIRVSQNWGGKGWGGMFIPHVGQEVIVQFLEGDPDMPLITGRVYNAENMPPVELPGGKTQSIIRDHGANEIKMQGEAGKQSIRMFSPHANTIFKMGAPNEPSVGFFFKTVANAAWEIGTNLLINVTGFKKEAIKGPAHEWVLGLSSKFIGGIKQETVVGAEVKTNVVNKTEFIKGATIKLHSGKEYKHEKSGKGEKSAGLIQMAKDVKQFRDAEKKIVKANKILKVAGKKHDKADKMIWDAIDAQHTSYNLKEIAKAERKEKQATKTVKTTGSQMEKAADMKFQASQIVAKGIVKLG